MPAAKKSSNKTKATTTSHSHIVFPVDVSENSSHLRAVAVVQQLLRKFDSKLTIVTVLPEYNASIVAQYFSNVAEEALRKEAEKALKVFAKNHFPDFKNVAVVVRQGGIYEQIIETAQEVGGDIIVMTAHRPGLQDYLLGPNAAKVVRHSELSVLVIREE